MLIALSKLFSDFFNSEKIGGYILMACAVVAVAFANSPWAESYLHLWHTPLPGGSLEFWINDGLMAVFFLLVGLEIERELYIGELRSMRNAVTPLLAALGGMVVPASVYFFINAGLPSQSGFGIPMATDIAFALGILSLAKNVPVSLKIFLTALAIIDDLGAILVIAFIYGEGFSWHWFAGAAGIFGAMLLLNRLKVHNLLPYLIGGAALWYALHHAGIHATIAGVLTAFALPFGDGGEKSPSYVLQHHLHLPVALGIMPLFALANAGLTLSPTWTDDLVAPIGMGILAGLLLGKPVGVLLGVWLSKLLKKKGDVEDETLSWRQYTGAGILAGIGFTMSIFITLLAMDAPEDILAAKTAIFAASLIAAIIGFLFVHKK